MPCRHLVACKECALNMLEFGAGGSVHQPVEDGADGAAPGEGSVPQAAGGEAAGGITGLGGNGRTERRRKRKVKGWFCPICRQAYTSMLRISAAAPAGELVAEIEDSPQKGDDADADHPAAQRASTSTVPAGWKVHEEGSPASRSENGSPAPEGNAEGSALALDIHAHEHEHEHEHEHRQEDPATEDEFATAPATPTSSTPVPAEPPLTEEQLRS